jgi:hypothetical protein
VFQFKQGLFAKGIKTVWEKSMQPLLTPEKLFVKRKSAGALGVGKKGCW